MRNAKWVIFAVALGMMAATAGWLYNFRKAPKLGPPGVKVSQVPIYAENNKVAGTQSIVLPTSILGISAIPSKYSPITISELEGLPSDTTYGRRIYQDPVTKFTAQINVILMGTDHTSIHQPQYCLYSADWNITNTSRVMLPMDRPYEDIPAIKMVAVQQAPNGETRECLYVYWFVSGDKITAEEGSRLWSMWKTVVQKGEMERWAYISYFVTCIPGDEQGTFERLEKFIRASVPEFQLVKGNSSGQPEAMAAQK